MALIDTRSITEALKIVIHWKQLDEDTIGHARTLEIEKINITKTLEKLVKSTKCYEYKDDNALELYLSCRLGIIPLEFVLAEDIIGEIISYFSCEELFVGIELNSWWRDTIRPIKIFEDFWENLNNLKKRKILREQRFGIYLRCNYSWENIGYNRRSWELIWKVDKELPKAMDQFVRKKIKGRDRIWSDFVKKLKKLQFIKKYKLRGYFGHNCMKFVAMRLAQCFLRGIRSNDDEYEEGVDYQSEDDEYEPMYKHKKLYFINDKPENAWNLLCDRGGAYEEKVDMYLILEVYLEKKNGFFRKKK